MARTVKIQWVTDIHLNFLGHHGASRSFGEYLRDETEGDILVVSGDISEAPSLNFHLSELKKGWGPGLHFVLGNHDYYRGSFRSVSESLVGQDLGWLSESAVQQVTPDVALVGQDGWYDGYYGDPYNHRFWMADWDLIEDMKEVVSRQTKTKDDFDRGPLLDFCRTRSQAQADLAEVKIQQALDTSPVVIFATHVPPFEGATWHEGEQSSPVYMPWFSSKLMGDMLLRIADRNPQSRIVVMCGHTHSQGHYKPRANLEVLTGRAQYGNPDFAGTLNITGNSILVNLKTGTLGQRTFNLFQDCP